jgi:hypothetical protein
MEPNTCPHCGKVLSDAQMVSLIGRYSSSKRTVHSGGRPRKSWPVTRQPIARAQVSSERQLVPFEEVE